MDLMKSISETFIRHITAGAELAQRILWSRALREPRKRILAMNEHEYARMEAGKWRPNNPERPGEARNNISVHSWLNIIRLSEIGVTKSVSISKSQMTNEQ
jgi:hypothetical protein